MSKSVRVSIKERDLRRLIGQELKALNEEVDADSVKDIVNAAAKLLKATRQFKEDANVAMTNATTPHLDALIQAVSAMVETPASYVDQLPPTQKRVQLRQVSTD